MREGRRTLRQAQGEGFSHTLMLSLSKHARRGERDSSSFCVLCAAFRLRQGFGGLSRSKDPPKLEERRWAAFSAFKVFLVLFFVLWFGPAYAGAEQFPFHASAAGLPKSMNVLAKALIRDYREKDEPAYLDNLFRLQIVAQDYAGAVATIGKLRALRMATEPSPQTAAGDIVFEIYARAMARRSTDFAAAFAAEFRARIGVMDDRSSALAVRMFNARNTGGLSLIIDQTALRQTLDGLLEKQKKKATIALSDALALVRAYQIEAMYRAVSPYAPPS